MMFLAAGIGPGDEVVVPSFSFAATANAVALTGATPVFADIEPESFCLSPAAFEGAITPKTRGVMPVHLYGHPADMKAITAIADAHDILVFEDAAQAHAAAIDGTPVGAWSLAAAFSFYPTKNMTSGEGGIVSTPDAAVARSIRVLRNQGMERRYENEVVGFNTRMTDLHAAIGRAQLRKLAGWTERRQANAAFLSEHLDGVVVPSVAPGATHVWHQYTIRVEGRDRDAFASLLTDRGVGNGVYYPTPIHRLPSFAMTLDLPETERATSEVLSLPVYPSLTEQELETIVETVNEVARAGA
jgi:dTDP-4-amino-4,6-dideoxygalactose transaminase